MSEQYCLDNLPPFSALPLNPNDPPLSAWGLYGTGDELGTLNLLTQERILSAASQIRLGKRISLNWELHHPATPLIGRLGLNHRIIWKKPRVVNDDVVEFNTQAGTQWDGLRHFAYQSEAKFYGGVTQDQIHTEGNIRLSQHHVAEQGIVGRGILIDFYRYAQSEGLSYDPFSPYSISVSGLKAAAASQGVELHLGDILLVRSGFTDRYNKLSKEEQARALGNAIHTVDTSELPQSLEFAGVESSKEVAAWLWDNHVAAVAGDAPAFERLPFKSGECLHEWLLSGWGCPIGELFDLEQLALECERQGRWTFFFVSEPLAIRGGVASPPNALAIL